MTPQQDALSQLCSQDTQKGDGCIQYFECHSCTLLPVAGSQSHNRGSANTAKAGVCLLSQAGAQNPGLNPCEPAAALAAELALAAASHTRRCMAALRMLPIQHAQ